jgi:2-aminoadipate transaminase
MPLERRKALLEKAIAAGVPVVEDDPYGALSYSGEELPSLLSMAPEHVIYMGSFSKVLVPGLRLGYVVAPEELLGKLVQAKQAADLHTAQLTQMVVHEVIKDGFLDHHIPTIRELYGNQCQVMLDAMAEHFPASATWTRPEGGMFIWATLPPHIDAMELLDAAIKDNVAFVPGAPFYANAPETNTLRLSFVTVPPERIRHGIAVLGKLIAARM